MSSRKWPSFDVWMKRVNKWLLQLCGMESGDLPDVDYMSMYEDMIPPREAAGHALQYADTGEMDY